MHKQQAFIRHNNAASKYGDKKYFMLIQRLCGRLIGFWVGDDDADIKSWQIILAVFSAMEIWFVAVFQIWFCAENIENLMEFLRGVAPLITQFLTAFKILSIVWKRKQFKMILDFLERSFVDGEIE